MDQCCGLRTVVEDGWCGGHIPVPLTGVQIHTRLVNFTAQTTVTQTYVNREENPIECVYFFPLEEEAAVVDFRAEIQDRVLVSKIKKSEEAEKDYNDAIKEGRTGFLMEETREDILQIKVGHLSPGDTCSIAIIYIQEVPLETGKTRLTIPTTISPKYIPFHDESPEAKRIATIKYDFTTPAKLKFSLETCMKSRIESVTSPSHKLVTEGGMDKDQHGFYTSSTVFEASTSDMDRDIVVLVQCRDPNKSIIFVEEYDETKVMMLSLVPKLELKVQSILDVVFLVDCSGSMYGSSIKLAKEAIQILLHSLPSSVYFNIVCFGSRYSKVFPASRIYNDKSLTEAKIAAEKIESNLGGTEILAPLTELLEEKTEVPRRVFVLTDGSVSNSQACIKLAQRNSKRNRVFALGIGSAADRHLVKGLARAGLGTAEFTVEGEIMAPKILKQLKNCLQPNLTDLDVSWGNSVGPENSCQAPAVLPPVYNGHRIQIFRMFEKDSKLPGKVHISANIPGDTDHYDEVVEVETSVMKSKLLHQMFARKLIQGLEENFDDKEEKEVKSLVTELSLKYQLMSKYTSFVAVDTKENKSEQLMLSRQVANQVPAGFGSPMMGCGGGGGRRMKRMAAPQALMCAAPMMAPNAMMAPMAMRCMAESNSRDCLTSGGFEAEMEEEEKVTVQMDEISIVLKLISLQTADGYFRKDSSIFSLCHLNEGEVKGVRGGLEKKLFYTLLVLTLLEQKYIGSKDCWEMVVEKGRGWIKGRDVPEHVEQSIQKIIKKTL